MIFLSLLLLAAFSCTRTNEPAYHHPEPPTIDTNVVLPPAWALGVLYGGYTNQAQTINRIQQIQAHDYPIDAYWIDSWFWSFDDQGEGPDKYIDFVADTSAFPDRKGMWSFMEKNNIKGGFWTWDAIQQTGNEAAFEDFEKKGFFRNVYMNTNPWHNKSTTTAMFQQSGNKEGTPTGNIDFDQQEAADYFKRRMKHFFDEGADFLKLDRTTHLPTVRTIFEISQEFGKETKGRGFMLSHAGGLDDPAFKKYPAKWTSDTRSDWTVEAPTKKFNSWVPKVAFKENITKFTDPEKLHHTVPFMTNDTGGFDVGLSDEVDEELYIRWLQFSAFNPIMEVFSQPENPTSNLAWNYSERADEIFQTYTHLRMRLFPYLYSYAHQTRLTGQNIIRLVPGQLYEFKFGEEILVAPVYEQGATERRAWLPEGTWVNYWTGESFAGSQEIIVKAPIEQVPLFIKAGAILPMRAYASSIETGTNEQLSLQVYEGNGAFTLIEDDGLSNDYLEGRYATTEIVQELVSSGTRIEIAPVLGDYEGMPASRNWSIDFKTDKTVTGVLVNGADHSFSSTSGGIKIEGITAKRDQNLVVDIQF
jgi:alpha-glucosidase (family GH31 glycosyl hydrolase)